MPTPISDIPAVLAFEARNIPIERKHDLIRKTFGVNTTRYYQALLRHVRTPEALRIDPQLCRRILDGVERRHALRNRSMR
jgi:hypothetical protein